MKKLSILLLAAMAMVSCGNTYKAQTVELSDQMDSLNYTLGLVNGLQIRQYYMRSDSSEAVINEFMTTLENAYQDKLEKLTESEELGKRIATSVRECEKTGLVENPSWQLNEKVLLQALVNGIEGDTTMMQGDEARTYFQTQYSASRAEMNEDVKPAKAIKCSKLPKAAKTLELKTLTDSLNYAFGVMTGSQVKMYALSNDSDGNMLREFRDGFNKTMKASLPLNAQLVDIAENIGTSIREQEEVGLLGVEGVDTRFDLLRQGFINGLSNYTEQMDLQTAQTYVTTTMDELKNGPAKAEGAKFLKENAEREGVFVTESGLQYEIIKDAKGKKPAATDRVKVHYEGKLLNGEIFDSSFQRGEPITFALNQVIPGWTEGVQLMSVGAKYRFFIPYELGYGERGAAGAIPPYATLIFEVELLGIEK